MKKARFWFEKAAKQGNSWAMDAYGARLEADLKDVIGAKEWYEKSVRADNYPKALVHLGHIYHDGKAGIPKDPKEAFRLFQLAADQGYDEGLEWVGLCYEMGPNGGGVPVRDMEKSLFFRLKAAELGNTTAMHNVGTTLLTIASEKYNSIEIAGKSPIPQVLYWFRKASALGDTDSQNMVTQLERNLSSLCATCKSENGGKKLNRCVRCKAVYYCGSDCQKKHWAVIVDQIVRCFKQKGGGCSVEGTESNRNVKAASVRFHIMGRHKRSILEIALDDSRYRYLHKNRLFVLHFRRAVVLPHPLQSMQSNSFGYNVTPRATSPEKCRNNIPLCTNGRRGVMKTNIN
jgi:TPR repeat protein